MSSGSSSGAFSRSRSLTFCWNALPLALADWGFIISSAHRGIYHHDVSADCSVVTVGMEMDSLLLHLTAP